MYVLDQYRQGQQHVVGDEPCHAWRATVGAASDSAEQRLKQHCSRAKWASMTSSCLIQTLATLSKPGF